MVPLLSRMKKINIPWVLIFILFLGLWLRLIHLEHATFGYDQARDGYESIAIWTTDPIKITGPTSDIPGFTHGPLYFYMISPFYYFSPDSIIPLRIFSILYGLVSVVLVYVLAHRIMRNNTIALLSAFCMTVSFEAIQYSRWLSNPSYALPFIALFFYGLWIYVHRRDNGLPLMILMWGFMIHFQIFLLYFAIFIAAGIGYRFWHDRWKFYQPKPWHILPYLGALGLAAPFVAAQIKFGYTGIINLLDSFSHGVGNDPIIDEFLGGWANLHYNGGVTFFEGSTFAGLAMIIVILLVLAYMYVTRHQYRNPFLFFCLWFFSPIMIYPLEQNGSYFLHVGNIFPLVILVSTVLYMFWHMYSGIYKWIVIATSLLLLFAGNYHSVVTENKSGENLFSVQQNMDWSYHISTIDWIYEQAKGEPFAINTVTNPLFINTTWAYLFEHYGLPKYGYMPTWAGPSQVNRIGHEAPFGSMDDRNGDLLFLIVEPEEGISQDYLRAYREFEDMRSIQLVAQEHIGDNIIEKRQITEDKRFDIYEMIDIVKGFSIYPRPR